MKATLIFKFKFLPIISVPELFFIKSNIVYKEFEEHFYEF